MDRQAVDSEVSLEGHTILVVDDDPACRMALQECLEAVGADVEPAGRGDDALRYLDLVRPSAVVLDYQMPSMSGLTLLRSIRARPNLEDLPAIMVTATSDQEEVRLQALEAGVDDFLQKPVEPVELRLRLRNLLRLQSYRMQLEREKRSLEAEVAHRTAEVRYQALVVQSVADAIVSTDPEFRVRTWNPGAEAVYGVRTTEALDRPLFELLSTVWEDDDQATMHRALAESGRWTGHLTQASAGGRAVRVRASVTRVDDPGGGVDGYALVHHDLTEQTRARQLMAQAEAHSAQSQRLEALGAMTGNLAHDFNNWLGVIMSYTAMALEESVEGDPRRSDLEVVLDASNSASSVVRHLLAFSRRQVLEPVRADPNALASHLFSMMSRVLGPKVTMALDLADDVPGLRVDVGQMERVLMNLIVNARDAMPDGGRLTMGTRRMALDEGQARLRGLDPGVYAQLFVVDTGIGMDESTRIRVFEPFFTTKDADHGTGLGLSSVYGIVRQSGGEVSVDSQVGRGSRFEVWLPADKTSTGDLVDKKRSAISRPPSKATSRVLLVEDQTQLRKMVIRALRSENLTLEAASTGEEGLARLRECAPDLLITDVAMPGLSGPELVQTVRAEHPHLPVLFVTGYWTGDLPAGSAEDPTYLLMKPFTPRKLRCVVSEILEDHGP